MLRSVGAGGGRPPPATRWVASRDVPLSRSLAESGRSLVRRCHLWANLEEREARPAGLSSQGTAGGPAEARRENDVQYRRPQLLKTSRSRWLRSALQRLPSVAAAGGDGLAGGSVQVDGRWRRGLGRSFINRDWLTLSPPLDCSPLYPIVQSDGATTSSATNAVGASSAMLPLVTAQTVASERGVGGRISR
jgi:hypothetical protein